MKKIIVLFFLCIAFLSIQGISFAQSGAPNGINYQAVIRDNMGTLVANAPVAIRINIRQNSASGVVIFSEKHLVTTTQYGLVNFVIGAGAFLNGGPFATINWGNGPYYLDLGVAISGLPNPTSYLSYGTQQMMSVPFALYAKSSGNLLNQWKYGTGVPAVNLGTTGDYYLDTATGNVYSKTNGTMWILISNIMGPQGLTGATGPQGITGLSGPQGPQGANGATGLTGPAGPQGLIGPTGIAGTNGAQGIQGLPGTNGAVGATGPTGLTGPAGATGAQGIQGLPGTNGTNGAVGATGPIGAQGIPGTNGAVGANGTNGLTALVKTTVEPAGPNCVAGGTKVENGLDANNNGILDAGEVNGVQTTYVCNGSGGGNLGGVGFNANHGYLNLANDTFFVANTNRLVEVILRGGNGGSGGNAGGCPGGSGWNGGAGGSGAGIRFLLNISTGDTLHLNLGSNGLNGCGACVYTGVCTCCFSGQAGTSGSSSRISINSSNFQNYIFEAQAGGGGGAGLFQGTGGTGGGGGNGSLIYGSQYQNVGAFILDPNLNGQGAAVILRW